ncbi:MAG: type I DNA topoisomerase [Clostridiales bacterium]|nr:type I DNA topoisomerase [Clostridiales bacterium]
MATKQATNKTTKAKTPKKSQKQALVIVESPAKAKTIGKFLGSKYKIEASNGHVRDLPKSQLGVDVENNFEPRYITIRGRGPIIEKIKREAKNASRVYLATDPDREGEAISWHLAHILGLDPDSPCRIEFHEITKGAVTSAIDNCRPLDVSKVDAQQARRVLDRLVGYKISPLLWAKVRKGLSAGRVQSVATKMIVDREREIEKFVPEEYWTIDAKFEHGKKNVTFKLSFLGGEKAQIASEESAKEAVERIEKGEYTVNSIKLSERRKSPPPPFTTSNLQQEAARKLNFTTSKTMLIAQQLYEGVEIEGEGSVGLVSYIRTDSTRVSQEALADVRNYISENYDPAYLPEIPNTFKSKRGAQDAHEAIRPTSLVRTPDSIKDSVTRDQYKLYKLIYSRFIASQMTNALYDVVSAKTSNGDAEFSFTGMKKKFQGFTVVYEESLDTPEEKETSLPDLKEGQVLKLVDVNPEQHFTQPPQRYTEASLVRALEDDGIGRPSTYAPTISTIITRGYIKRQSRTLFPTELGVIVTDIMGEYFDQVVDIEFTANLEEKLDDIEEGSVKWQSVIDEFYDDFKHDVENAEEAIEKIEIADEESDIICDKCGARMVYKMGRFGRFLACPNYPQCKNTMAIIVPTQAKCPKCGKQVLERTSRRGKKFYGCEGYPECDFVLWDMPVKDPCPICGSIMVQKFDRKGAAYSVCTNEECKHKVTGDHVEND